MLCYEVVSSYLKGEIEYKVKINVVIIQVNGRLKYIMLLKFLIIFLKYYSKPADYITKYKMNTCREIAICIFYPS